MTTCNNDGDCPTTSYCNRNSYPAACAVSAPLGGACVVSGISDAYPKCATNTVCFNNTYISIFSSGQVNGACVAMNSFSTGTVAYAPFGAYSWYTPQFYGMQLCATGLSVSVANATGFPTGQFRCVDAVDISQQGAACDKCNYLTNVASGCE